MLIKKQGAHTKIKKSLRFLYKKLIKLFTLVFFNLVLFFKLRMLIKKQGVHTKIKKSVRFVRKKVI